MEKKIKESLQEQRREPGTTDAIFEFWKILLLFYYYCFFINNYYFIIILLIISKKFMDSENIEKSENLQKKIPKEAWKVFKGIPWKNFCENGFSEVIPNVLKIPEKKLEKFLEKFRITHQ